jgi:hypothetical protein
VAELQHTGAGLEEERAEEKEVVAADERDLDIGQAGELPVEVTGGGEAADPAAENDDPGARRGRAGLGSDPLTISTSGFPLSTTYVASSAPLSLPTFLAAWMVPPGMNRTSPALSVTVGLPSTSYSREPSMT